MCLHPLTWKRITQSFINYFVNQIHSMCPAKPSNATVVVVTNPVVKRSTKPIDTTTVSKTISHGCNYKVSFNGLALCHNFSSVRPALSCCDWRTPLAGQTTIQLHSSYQCLMPIDLVRISKLLRVWFFFNECSLNFTLSLVC